MRHVYLIILISTIVFGCEKNELKTENVLLFENIELRYNECYNEFENLEVCFVSVSDGRCPGDVICFWEGNATVKLEIKFKNIKQDLILDTNYKFKIDTIIGFYYISLTGLNPYPVSQTPFNASDYKAKLLIANLDKVISNAKVLSYGKFKTEDCWGWTIKMGNDTIKSRDHLLALRLGYDIIVDPIDVYIELGDPAPNCKNIIDGSQYSLKELIKTK